MFPMAVETTKRTISLGQWLQGFALIYLIALAFVIYISSRTGGPIVIPGDIYIKKSGRTLYVPLASSLVVSVIIFLILRNLLGY